MMKFLAGVLSVIAVGVLLIAYGLLNNRAGVDAASVMAAAPRAMALSEPVALREQVPAGYATYVPYGYVPSMPQAGFAPRSAQEPVYMPAPVSYAQPVAVAPRPVRTVSYDAAPSRRVAPRTQYVERAPRRDWKRTAMIVGGSTAAGAGVGALIGGKKGALIGAAIAGGATTIYQTRQQPR
jgi:hypothetical protein